MGEDLDHIMEEDGENGELPTDRTVLDEDGNPIEGKSEAGEAPPND